MNYTLDDQLEDLCKMIKAALVSAMDPAGVRELMIAQKSLLESMMIARHLESLVAQANSGCGGSCG